MLESFIMGSGTEITMWHLAVCTAVSAGLGLCLAAVHSYKNTSSRSFLMTLILLPVIVQVVIMLVNGNLGAGVAVMGAFSLVRFRSMPGSAREITSVFTAMAIGLADGMGYLGAAAFLTAAAAGITVLFLTLPVREDRFLQKDLKITIPENLDYSGIFDDIFRQYTRNTQLVRVKTVNMGSLYELEYEVLLKEQSEEKKMLENAANGPDVRKEMVREVNMRKKTRWIRGAAMILAGGLLAQTAGCTAGGTGTSSEQTQEISSEETAGDQETEAEGSGDQRPDESGGQTADGAEQERGGLTAEYDADDLNAEWSEEDAQLIVCSGKEAEITGQGAEAEDGVIRITQAGTYILRGDYEGQIQIETGEEDTVRLVLDGFSVYCQNTSPIYGIQCKKLVLTLAEGTENQVSDGESYTFESEEEDEPDAAIFCKDDLSINGTGSLQVNGNYSNGIRGKDDVKIISGQIQVTAAKDGIKGKDSMLVKGGQIQITSGEDGMMQAFSEESEQRMILVYYDETQTAGTAITLTDESGKEVFSWTPEKSYGCLLLSIPEFADGMTYTLASGESSQELSIEGIITQSGEGGFGGAGTGRFGGPGGGGQPGGQRPEGNGGQRPEGNDGQPPEGNGGQRPEENGGRPPEGNGSQPPENGEALEGVPLDGGGRGESRPGGAGAPESESGTGSD